MSCFIYLFFFFYFWEFHYGLVNCFIDSVCFNQLWYCFSDVQILPALDLRAVPLVLVLSIVPQGCCISNDRTPSVTHRISTYLSHSWLSAGGWLTNSAYLLLVCSWGWTTSWPLADLEWPLLGDWVTQLCSTSVSLPGAKRLGQICGPHSQGRHVRLCKGASGVCWFLFQ